jgi:hypothetical protein
MRGRDGLIAGLRGMAHELEVARRGRVQRFVEEVTSRWTPVVARVLDGAPAIIGPSAVSLPPAEQLAMMARGYGRDITVLAADAARLEIVPLTLRMLRAEWESTFYLADTIDLLVETRHRGYRPHRLRIEVDSAVTRLDACISGADAAEPARLAGLLVTLLGATRAACEARSAANAAGPVTEAWVAEMTEAVRGSLPLGPVLQVRARCYAEEALAPLSTLVDQHLDDCACVEVGG